MPVAARQCVATLTDDWITVEEAAGLVGESERAWQHKAALEAKSARQQLRASLAVKRRPDSGDGKAVWYVRRTFDARRACFTSHCALRSHVRTDSPTSVAW